MPGADHDNQFACAGIADRALRVAEADQHAGAVIAKVRAGELDAEGLALELAKAHGLALKAFARSIVKTIEGHS